ncbi:aspartate/glutamate racemase family protein [Puniceibacterium sp. IMCC21224]|uniref:aspartate/glutamate racemase family protein n=1 Tax=Puniceibacterium sp. IMCC21224 TaxID=1618204 RepID=UPI00064DD325|nr:aspartate/glutamate racemase family protein [Puniceibacterium sp. IMCC21224]KMK68459.1 hydantoin racemase [Puniceibacterium sp. IMCC21224]
MANILLMNPNSSTATTNAMVAIARQVLPGVTGWTAPSGSALLTSIAALDASATLVAAAEIPADTDGVIVSAFGDPGRAALAARLGVPVVGIGQSAALAASRGGRRYAVATHTPTLVASIDALMRDSAPGGDYLGTFLTSGDPHELGADPEALDAALLVAITRAHAAGAEAVIIGGGPLGQAAERLRDVAPPCEIIAPIPEAARLLARRLRPNRS